MNSDRLDGSLTAFFDRAAPREISRERGDCYKVAAVRSSHQRAMVKPNCRMYDLVGASATVRHIVRSHDHVGALASTELPDRPECAGAGRRAG